MSGLEWTTPKIEEVPMDGRYCALYRQALEEEPLAPWEKDAFDVAEAVLDMVEESDGCAVCVELEALIQTRRAVDAAPAPDPRLEEARAVRIEDEAARRGIKLRGGNERSGPCPACGGTDRFSINVKKQLWNCRVCQHGGDVIALVRHLDGVGFEDAVEKLSGRPAAKRPDAKPACTKRNVCARFDYYDAHGAVVYQVERVEYQNPDGSYVLGKDGKRKKDFPQRRPDPDHQGEWLWKVAGHVQPVPYRLPELIEAVGKGNLIVIVEGERKVDFLRGWGIAATCNSGGHGSVKDWAGHVWNFNPGDNVVILPDNDQAGHDHANAVAGYLKQVQVYARVLDLPGLGPKGDVIDWADAGGTAEQLLALIERDARPWVLSNGHDEAPGMGMGAVECADVASFRATVLFSVTTNIAELEMEQIVWLWPGWLAKGKLHLIAGAPEAGKTTIGLSFAAAISAGNYWPDGKRAPVGNVLIWTSEDNLKDTIKPRLVQMGADLSRIDAVTHQFDGKGKLRPFNPATDMPSLAEKADARREEWLSL